MVVDFLVMCWGFCLLKVELKLLVIVGLILVVLEMIELFLIEGLMLIIGVFMGGLNVVE